MLNFTWLIPVFPLLGFIILGFGKNIFKNTSAGIFSSLMILASFIISAGTFFSLGDQPATIHLFNWFNSGDLNIPFAFLIDHVTMVMLLIITGVGFLIHIYSIGYMKGDDGYSRFFSYLNLFVF